MALVVCPCSYFVHPPLHPRPPSPPLVSPNPLACPSGAPEALCVWTSRTDASKVCSGSRRGSNYAASIVQGVGLRRLGPLLVFRVTCMLKIQFTIHN